MTNNSSYVTISFNQLINPQKFSATRYRGTCPFCKKKDSAFMNTKTNRWCCFNCHLKGPFTFDATQTKTKPESM